MLECNKVQALYVLLVGMVFCVLSACGVARSPIIYPDSAIPMLQHEVPAGLSDVWVLEYGFDALSARVRLLRSAEKSIDLQYYIWHPDYTGQVMMHEVLVAAERGVKVRLIIDGLGAKDCLRHMRRLAVHENIEVRVFNSLGAGLAKAANILRIDRLQRRMHNKLCIMDGKYALTGGRNIGDAYF